MDIFIDLETTGVDVEDRLISIGIIYDKNIHYELIKPPLKIKSIASATNHISNEMLIDKDIFSNSKSLKILNSLNTKENTFITHNANFVIDMLDKEEFYFQTDIIDTQKCSKHLIKEIDNYTLQFLRYELKLYKDEKSLFEDYNIDISAHNPLSDALHIKLLYNYFNVDKKTLKLLSKTPILVQKFSFGKYKDKDIEDVIYSDNSYIQWLLNSDELDEDLSYTLKYYTT